MTYLSRGNKVNVAMFKLNILLLVLIRLYIGENANHYCF